MSGRIYRRVDGIPAGPDEFAIRTVTHPDGRSGPHLWFTCPRRGEGLCGVPLLPSPPNSQGCSWNWDGNGDAPTLTPSVDCRVRTKPDSHDPTAMVACGGCGWHGWVERGEFRDA